MADRVTLDVRIPIHGEPDLPWQYFVLEAARGGVRVPDWVLLAVPMVVGRELGLPPEEITGEHVEQAVSRLPADPTPLLSRLLAAVGEELPDPERATLRIDDEAGVGAFRDPVPLADLLHDAALIVQLDYGREGFFACTDALFEEPGWDARGAVAAMMYLLLLR